MLAVFDTNQKSKAHANITAVYIYNEAPSKEISVALGGMESSDKWKLVRLHIDAAIAEAFRIVKVPTLVVYNASSEETARVFGEQNITDLITKVIE